MNHPEHEPSIMNERRVANRFCELVSPSPDHPEMGERNPRAIDYTPPLRAAHVFKIADDVAGRDDPKLGKTLAGSLDAHWPELERINRERRTGVFLALDPSTAIVAEFVGEPTRGFPVLPSFSILFGTGVGADRGDLRQHVWLLSQEMPPRDRADIAAQLRIHGARHVAVSEPALVRVPGFHARRAGPFMVRYETPASDFGKAIRHDPRELRRTFLQLSAGAEAV